MSKGPEPSPSKANGSPPRVRPVPAPRVVLCPFCGGLSADLELCTRCKGRFDPLSRQASQNSMGPWSIRDDGNPFAPSCSFETIRTLIARGRILPNTVVRGPTTNQFWTLAKRAPSIANLLGLCHNCQEEVGEKDFACTSCGAPFTPEADRQHLGLAPLQHLPGQAPPEVIAALSGPPLGVEPIEVIHYGKMPKSNPESSASPATPPQQHAPEEHERDDTRMWIMLGAAVIVVTILGAVFGPELARSLSPSGPRAGDSPAQELSPSDQSSASNPASHTPQSRDQSIDESDNQSIDLVDVRGLVGESVGGTVGVTGDGAAVGGGADAAGGASKESAAVMARINALILEDSDKSLATALDLVRSGLGASVSAEDRGRLAAVLERRRLRAKLLALP